jgi:hypothetical protein
MTESEAEVLHKCESSSDTSSGGEVPQPPQKKMKKSAQPSPSTMSLNEVRQHEHKLKNVMEEVVHSTKSLRK